MSVQAGDKIPESTLKTMGEKGPTDITTDEIFAGKKVVLFAVPGAFTPGCSMTHLPGYVVNADKIKAMGVDVFFISNDRPEILYSSLAQETKSDIDGLDYTILSDAKASAAVAFGIAFKAPEKTIQRRHDKGQDIEASSMALHGVLPVPSVFAIDTDGKIRFAYSNADYKVRLPADELLEVAADMTVR